MADLMRWVASVGTQQLLAAAANSFSFLGNHFPFPDQHRWESLGRNLNQPELMTRREGESCIDRSILKQKSFPWPAKEATGSKTFIFIFDIFVTSYFSGRFFVCGHLGKLNMKGILLNVASWYSLAAVPMLVLYGSQYWK